MKTKRNRIKVTAEKKSQLKEKLKQQKKLLLNSFILFVGLITVLGGVTAYATNTNGIIIDFTTDVDGTGAVGALDILILFTVMALIPTIVLMMTSFTRIVIVLSFLRNALGTQQSPPNPVIIGLSIFLTLFIMSPVFEQVNEQAYQPYKNAEITQEEALQRAAEPMKEFMIRHTDKKSLNLFLSIANRSDVKFTDETAMETLKKESLSILVPAFVTSELTKAFSMGFLIFLPFLIIDIVVSSLLMSMGMVMLPPAMIALPFKLLMFILVDGWTLLMGTLVQSFH